LPKFSKAQSGLLTPLGVKGKEKKNFHFSFAGAQMKEN